jgi:hypothetical protein
MRVNPTGANPPRCPTARGLIGSPCLAFNEETQSSHNGHETLPVCALAGNQFIPSHRPMSYYVVARRPCLLPWGTNHSQTCWALLQPNTSKSGEHRALQTNTRAVFSVSALSPIRLSAMAARSNINSVSYILSLLVRRSSQRELPSRQRL